MRKLPASFISRRITIC